MNQPSVLITGAAGGIGRPAARTFAGAGYRVCVADLHAVAVEDAAAELREQVAGADVLPLVFDQSDESSILASIDAIRTWTDSLTSIALVAGTVQDKTVPVTELDVAEWDRVHNVNLRGVFLSAKHLIPLLTRDGSGSLTAIASYFGRTGFPLFAGYCTSKAGVISLVQTLALELADEGIRANAIAPGSVNTGMHRKALVEEAAVRGVSFEEMRDEYWRRIPLKRAADPQDIADALLFLASPQSKYITGATLDVNGGVMLS